MSNILKKVKLIWNLLRLKGKIKEVFSMKSGWKTTEFWITIVTVLASLYGAAQGFLSPELVSTISGIAVAAYALARAIVKATSTKADDEFLEKIAEAIKKKLG